MIGRLKEMYRSRDGLGWIVTFFTKDRIDGDKFDELAKALEEHHVPNIRIDFPNSDHIMWNDQDCMERFREAVLQYCGQYLKLSPKDEK